MKNDGGMLVLQCLFLAGVGLFHLIRWILGQETGGRIRRGGGRVEAERLERRGPQALRNRLQALANNLHRGRVARTGQYPRVLATHEGRQVYVELTDEERVAVYGVTLEAPLQGLRLEVSAREGEERYEVDYEGDSETKAARAADLLRRAGVKRGLGQLFQDLGITRVKVEGDQVKAWRKATSRFLAAERVKRILRCVLSIAREAERVVRSAPALPPRAEGEPELAPRRAGATDWSERTCPYCRDSLAEGARLSCEACHSVLHAECYGELGKCTTYGCEGRRGFPVVDDAGPARIVIGSFACDECGLRTAGCSEGDCRGSRRERKLNRVRERGRRRRTRERGRWRA
ncbi:MAG: hypothetical protein AB7N76_18805 [Planctomycetota bacterium]